MKHFRPLMRPGIYADNSGLQPLPVSKADNPDAVKRISTPGPHIVVLLAVLGSAVAFSSALQQMAASGDIPWAMLALGSAHAIAALAGFMAWKCVRYGNRHYVVSDFFKSETISFDDVCMVVNSHGFLWNTARIHLRRPSRFGWTVSFVPVHAVRESRPLFSAKRTQKFTDGRLVQASQGAIGLRPN